MNQRLKQRKLWLDLALFSGPFLSIYGFISGFEACGGFFTCSDIVNKVSITFYQELLMYLGIALFISSIGFMSIGEAGSGGHFPSKRAIFDYAIIMGAFLFAAGFGAYDLLCSGKCVTYSYGLGFPLMLIGGDAIGFSLYKLNKNHGMSVALKETHIFRWELITIISASVLLISELITPLNGQTIIPLLQFNNVTPSQLGFVFASLLGMIFGIYEMRKEQAKLRKLQRNQTLVNTTSPPLPTGR
jgi:hypothetical protein